MNIADVTIATEVVTEKLLREVAQLYPAENYKAAVWRWQFSPRFGREVLCIVAREKGKLVGFNATMPVSLVDDGDNQVDAIWSCDFIVAPSCRGTGVGKAIKDEMARAFKMPIMSLGISNSAFPLLMKKGWHAPTRLDVWDLVLKPKTGKQLLLVMWVFLCRLFCYHSIKQARKRYLVEEMSGLPQERVIQRLWHLHRAHSRDVEVVRNYDYLHWRYEKCPFSVYRFLHLGCSTQGPQAFIVFRLGGTSIEVIDFVGVKNTAIISAACSYWLKAYPDLSAIHWNSSIRSLRSGLVANGFVKKNYGSRFATLSNFNQANWGLVAGDSDGDFLRVAKEQFNPSLTASINKTSTSHSIAASGRLEYICPDQLIYRSITEQEFFTMEPQWNELLQRSEANPLFLSWSWQSNWWRVWGKSRNLQLHLLLVFKQQQLVGILPLYKYKKYFFDGYQFIGNAWGLFPSIRSEYITPIFDQDEQRLLYKSLQAYISTRSPTSSFIFADSPSNPLPELYYWQHRKDVGYVNDVSGDFNQYLAALGRMTRLKAFNRRSYLFERYPSAQLTAVARDRLSLEIFFNHLNSFHLLRWGKPCFESKAVRFHIQLLMGDFGRGARLSYLVIDEAVVSASYNIEADGVVYNIQSGYLEEFDKKMPLGTLHMGWVLEQAFNDDKVQYFDFLAGLGRMEDYKKHYRGDSRLFYTLQYFSSKRFGFIFSRFFLVRSLLKSSMKFILQRAGFK